MCCKKVAKTYGEVPKEGGCQSGGCASFFGENRAYACSRLKQAWEWLATDGNKLDTYPPNMVHDPPKKSDMMTCY